MYKTHYTGGFVSHCEMELSVSISVHINTTVPLNRLILGNACTMYRDTTATRKIQPH